MNELKHNAFLNSASNSPNSAKRFLRKRFRSFEVTQRLASTVARGNSASRSPTQQNAFYESVLGRSE
ncbi:hypothetical protein LEP1GSC186_2587 [Leptospira noguchii serovar Autumnalis str. ZUN142]|uniref:Uncharacterized protein n=1 Tax=Leptospira noguchii serovar Autumnalis str. ZUN142 TaxID=1085540 RepID=M6UJV5_9LEPT|nr:hypothetical protein LEP1GSC186_2587 [Leptospira noguchii serovar Autumnalis str. ZUN142]